MRVFAAILCLIIVFTFFGCTERNNLNAPVAFYYCVNDIDHLNDREVFGKEIREGDSFSGDLIGLLNEYFNGPESDKHYNPFPAGSKVLDVKREGNVLTLHLSDHFDRLPLEKLSLAISCLVQTIFNHTSIPVLLLIPYGTFIDGSTYKTYTADSFLYSDGNTDYSPPQ